MVVEFTRKQRSFDQLEHCKATEYRMFLCYIGMAAFKGILPESYYNHFLLLVCDGRIFTHPVDCRENYVFAKELLID